MGWVSLNTKQARAQVSENGKVIYGSAGGRRAGAAAGVPRSLCANCSAVTSTWCAQLPRVPLRGLGQAAHKGQGTREVDRGRDPDPKLCLLGSDPRPVHLLCPNCSEVPVSAPPRHPDCRPSGSLAQPAFTLPSRLPGSQPSTQTGRCGVLLICKPTATPPRSSPRVCPSLPGFPQQLSAFALGCALCLEHPSPSFWPALCSRPPRGHWHTGP